MRGNLVDIERRRVSAAVEAAHHEHLKTLSFEDTTDFEDAEAVLTVTDDGPGIPAEFQPEIFERFARGDTSRSRKGGSTGLGLAIASAVVRAHTGTIGVTSTPGHTEFMVRLPR
jgi:signal transduction histidine kinase